MFHHSIESKNYYLQSYRIYPAILFFFIFSLLPFWIDLIDGSDFSNSFKAYLKDIISFTEVTGIFLLFSTIGIIYLKNSKKMIRAKIDDKGLWYPKITSYIKLDKLNLMLKTPNMDFIPYNHIKSIELVRNRWHGDQIYVKTKQEMKNLSTLSVLSLEDKKNLVEQIKIKLKS